MKQKGKRMYIHENGLKVVGSAADNPDEVQMMETEEPATSSDSSDPGYAPISPNTPSWGPPSSVTSPGYAPISPNTPSWGPPSSVTSPGYAPISPNTPSWRPPQSITGGSGSGSGSNNRPIIVIPGQSGCINCNTSSNSGAANVRFLHAAVNQPAVNVRLGNRTVINNLQFGNFTPYYLDSNNQSTLVTVTSTQTGRTIFQRYINFSNRNAYTVSIINDGSGITLFTLTDTPCSYRNSACLRAVNLSSNSGPVDIFLSGYGRIFQRVGQQDATNYYAVNQGSYRAFVTEALPCTNNNAVIMADTYAECNNTRIAYMDSSTVNLMNGVTYTMYIIGLAYQFPSLQILTLESDLIY